MRLNQSSMEAPNSGEPLSGPSFDAGVQTSGHFLGRIKRSGSRAKQLGWVEVVLLDDDRIAFCADRNDDSEQERLLLFPTLEGSMFRQVKRHGNSLTLMAPSFSIVLESETGEQSAMAQASKWARILQRLSAQEDGSKSSAYFKGLGINLNNWTAKQHSGAKSSRKQLVPAQPSSQNEIRDLHDLPRSEPIQVPQQQDRASRPVGRPAVQPTAHQDAPPKQSALPSKTEALQDIPTNTIPRSASGKASKRLSLGLAPAGMASLDIGFGDDLKGILGALDSEPPANPVPAEAAKDSAPAADVAKSMVPVATDDGALVASVAATAVPVAAAPVAAAPAVADSAAAAHPAAAQKASKASGDPVLSAPSAPFSENGSSRTPSPNSLYLMQNASPSVSSFGSSTSSKELNRMESILVKEQQQQIDRYGARAATLSSFDLSLPLRPGASSSSPSSSLSGTAPTPPSNPPPRIPPPVPVSQPVKVAKRVSIAMTSPTVQYITREDSNDSDADSETEDDASTHRPSTETALEPSVTSKKDPSIMKAVKKFWGKRKLTKEQGREFKGPMELRREVEAEQRRLYDLPARPNSRIDSDYQDDSDSETEELPRNDSSSSIGQWRALAMVQEESETEKTPVMAAPPTPPQLAVPKPAVAETVSDERKTAQAVAPSISSGNSTSAVPKLNSQSSISALSFRSMRSQSSQSSGLSVESVKSDFSKTAIPASVHATPRPTPHQTHEAKLDPKRDPSWLGEQRSTAAPVAVAPIPPPIPLNAPLTVAPSKPAVAPKESLDPGRSTITDHTTNPIIRKVFESGNNSTLALGRPDDTQHSASSSYSSFSSFKRSAPSYGSQASSLSSISYSNSSASISAPNLFGSQKPSTLEMNLFGANLWVSKWVGAKWTPLSQLELRTDVVATASSTRLLIMNPGGVGSISLLFSQSSEIRRVSAHDIELKTGDSTYMFRSRDADQAQKFWRTLSSLQTDGGATSLPVVMPRAAAAELDRDIMFDTRRRTLVPPVLSRSNHPLKYVGMSTSTIVEE